MNKLLYTAKATNVGGRSGHVETDDKRLSFDLTPSMSKTGTNPEQLFACGYSACFGSAVDAVAKKENVTTGEVTVTVSVDLNQGEHGFFLGATLDVTLPALNQAEAEKIVRLAHHLCPYSKATRGNIEVKLQANGLALAEAA